MKKVIVTFFVFLGIFSLATVYASTSKASSTDQNGYNLKETESKLVEIKDKELKSMDDYKEAYGNDTYGIAAYILSKVRTFSLPICFVGIAISAIYQSVIGIRKLDVRDRGFNAMIGFVTLLIICQVLPLIFTIVVKGWRG